MAQRTPPDARPAPTPPVAQAWLNDVHVWPVGSGGGGNGTPGASRWTPVRDTYGRNPPPRGHHCAVGIGSRLVIFGGSNGEICFNDVAYLVRARAT